MTSDSFSIATDSRIVRAGPERNDGPSFSWPTSWKFNFAVALVLGCLFGLLVMGPTPLNPKNTDWLTFDGATNEIGWEAYRQDSKLHWPVTWTDHIGYPQGESIYLLDSNPLLAVLLKPIGGLLPEPFQYLGLEVLLVSVLQTFFALLIFRKLIGGNPYGVVFPSIFLLIAPPLCYRFTGHYALANHWLILAAFYFLIKTQMDRPTSMLQIVGWTLSLQAIAISVNPYLAAQVLLVISAAYLAYWWQGQISFAKLAGIGALSGVTCIFVASAFGLLLSGGRGYQGGGYRTYSFNLIGFFDPQDFGSAFLPKLHEIATQYEGYSYLGFGVLVLLAVLVLAAFKNLGRWRECNYRLAVTLLSLFVLSICLAVSTKVTVGSKTLFDFDPQEHLTPYFSALRANGRFIWTAYYLLLMVLFKSIFSLMNWRRASTLCGVCLLLQLIDTQAIRQFVHGEVNQHHPSPLFSPLWHSIGKTHKNLLVMPPWQCSFGQTSPGGLDGYRTFGFLALNQHMRINSYYGARYTEVNRDLQCGKAVAELSSKPLDPNSFYVVTPWLAQTISDGKSGPGKCHSLDGFIVCTSKLDLGLGTKLSTSMERLSTAIRDSGFEDSSLNAWQHWQNVQAEISQEQARSGSQSLAEKDGAGSMYQDVMGLDSGETYVISAWAFGSKDATAKAQISVYDPAKNVAISSPPTEVTNGWHNIVDAVQVGSQGILRIHLFRNEGTGTIYWDDIRIYRQHTGQ